jgi:hypothetical protein
MDQGAEQMKDREKLMAVGLAFALPAGLFANKLIDRFESRRALRTTKEPAEVPT